MHNFVPNMFIDPNGWTFHKCPLLVLVALIMPRALFETETAETDEQVQDDCIQSDTSDKYAAEIKHNTVFHALLHHKVNINASDKDGNTALHVACRREITGMAKSLIDAGADVTLQNDCKLNPLHVAMATKNMEVIEAIFINDMVVERRLDLLQETDKHGHSIFLLAVKSGDDVLVQFLLDQDLVTVTDTNNSNENAFHLAAAINSVNIMRAICSYNENMAEGLLCNTDEKGYTPLHSAAENPSDQVDAVKFLIEK